MAERLARIIGTEEDKVNCPFYFKIGACRHGDNCTRTHLKPTLSQTIVLAHMYDNPPAAIALSGGTKLPEEMIKETVRHFEDFYEEVFLEMANFGEIEDLVVTDNIGDHIIGNAYVKYYDENDAERAVKSLTGRYYAGKLIMPEYCPVTNFRDAKCRQFEEGSCSRGGYCNFMHLKYVSKSFKKSLLRQMYEDHPEYLDKKRIREEERKNRSPEESPSRRRSRSPRRKSRRSRSHSKGRDKGGDRDQRRGRDRDSSRDRNRDRDRDRDRYRDKDKDRDRNRDRDRSRDRDRDRKPKRRDSRSRSPSISKQGGGFPRNSEERRAMIASWNQEGPGSN
jgi:splicing factor U2AF subunit